MTISLTPGTAVRSGAGPVSRSSTRRRRLREERAHVLDRDEAAGPDDGDPVAHPLDLGQDVGAEEHRAPGRLQPVEHVVERALHERVQALGRLVEDRELRVVLERLDDPDLLAHPAAVVADRPAEGPRIELEAVAQLGAADRWPAGELGKVVEVALAGEAVVQRDAAGEVADPAADRDAVAGRVEPEDRRPAGRRVQVAEQQPDERALARAVGAEEAEDLALADLEGHVIERPDHARVGAAATRRVVLGEPLGGDRGHRPKASRCGRPAPRAGQPMTVDRNRVRSVKPSQMIPANASRMPPTSAQEPPVLAPGSTAWRWNSSRLRMFALKPRSNRSPRIGMRPMRKSTPA